MTTLASNYLEYTYGSSSKFYRISLIEESGTFTARADWGRIGTVGQSGNKYAGPSRAAAETAYSKAESEKLGKGYTPASDPSGGATSPAAKTLPSAANVTAQVPAPATAAGSVPRFPAQLAGENGNLQRAIASPAGYAAEEKFDGVRALVVLGPRGEIAIRNREGADKGRITNTPEIAAALKALADANPELWNGTVFDGELVGRSWNETMHLLGSAGKTATGLRFAIFDLPYHAGSDLRNLPWTERRARLEKVLAQLPTTGPLQLVPVHSPVAGLVESIWAAGGEGLILKDRSARYMPGDRNAWSKVKQKHSAEGVILGFTAGLGKYANTLGAVVIGQYRGGELVPVVNLSGMTDEVRRGLSDADIGKVIEFSYQEKTIKDSYRHPVWMRMRPDKRAEDCTWEASA